MIQFMVSKDEQEILADIEDIGYGELYDVRLSAENSLDTAQQVSEQTARFLRFMRSKRSIARLIIHDSEPSMAEYVGWAQSKKRLCLRKKKFS